MDVKTAEAWIMKRLLDNTISQETTARLFKGIHDKNYTGWMKTGTSRDKKFYLPIGDVFGVEAQRNKTYFYNFGKNAKDKVRDFEYATLDGRQFFLRVILYDADDVFIPIR